MRMTLDAAELFNQFSKISTDSLCCYTLKQTAPYSCSLLLENWNSVLYNQLIFTDFTHLSV